jgi:hypothetical protein
MLKYIITQKRNHTAVYLMEMYDELIIVSRVDVLYVNLP